MVLGLFDLDAVLKLYYWMQADKRSSFDNLCHGFLRKLKAKAQKYYVDKSNGDKVVKRHAQQNLFP